MDKKEFKLYVTPAPEVIDLKLANSLLAGSGNAEGVEEETPDPDTDFELDD